MFVLQVLPRFSLIKDDIKTLPPSLLVKMSDRGPTCEPIPATTYCTIRFCSETGSVTMLVSHRAQVHSVFVNFTIKWLTVTLQCNTTRYSTISDIMIMRQDIYMI